MPEEMEIIGVLDSNSAPGRGEAMTVAALERRLAAERENARPVEDKVADQFGALAEYARDQLGDAAMATEFASVAQGVREATRTLAADAPDLDQVEALGAVLVTQGDRVLAQAQDQLYPGPVPSDVKYADLRLAMVTLELELEGVAEADVPRVAGELAASYGPDSLEARLLLSHRWGHLTIARRSHKGMSDPLANARESYAAHLPAEDVRSRRVQAAQEAAPLYSVGRLLLQRVEEARRSAWLAESTAQAQETARHTAKVQGEARRLVRRAEARRRAQETTSPAPRAQETRARRAGAQGA